MTVSELIIIVITAALLSNVVLSQFLGICSFLGVSSKTDVALGMGAAVGFVITVASAVAFGLYQILDLLGLTYMDTIVFILVIACLVQIVESFFKKYVPALYKALGVYLPLITTNCAVLGVALTNVSNKYNLIESVLCGFGTGVGYLIAIVVLAGIRERTVNNDVPVSFKGSPIVMITAGLMAIAFYGFANLAF